MLPFRIVTKKYRKDDNYFEAVLPSDEKVLFDPFVGCAIPLTDSEYEEGKGFEYENRSFLLTNFSVQQWDINSYMITPNDGGIIEL